VFPPKRDSSPLRLERNGTSFQATLSRNVVAWVAPSAAIDSADCILRATLSTGGVFTEQL